MFLIFQMRKAGQIVRKCLPKAKEEAFSPSQDLWIWAILPVALILSTSRVRSWVEEEVCKLWRFFSANHCQLVIKILILVLKYNGSRCSKKCSCQIHLRTVALSFGPVSTDCVIEKPWGCFCPCYRAAVPSSVRTSQEHIPCQKFSSSPPACSAFLFLFSGFFFGLIQLFSGSVRHITTLLFISEFRYCWKLFSSSQ